MDFSRLIFAVAIMRLAVCRTSSTHCGRTRPSETPGSDESLSIGGAAINVEIEAGDLSLSRTQVLDWVRRSACAVTEYYAGFPVRKSM